MTEITLEFSDKDLRKYKYYLRKYYKKPRMGLENLLKIAILKPQLHYIEHEYDSLILFDSSYWVFLKAETLRIDTIERRHYWNVIKYSGLNETDTVLSYTKDAIEWLKYWEQQGFPHDTLPWTNGEGYDTIFTPNRIHYIASGQTYKTIQESKPKKVRIR